MGIVGGLLILKWSLCLIKDTGKIKKSIYTLDFEQPAVFLFELKNFTKRWNKNNKCLGMCAITSLIVNDYFNGEICKIYVDDISHYFNLIEGEIIDLTSNQFNHEIE